VLLELVNDSDLSFDLLFSLGLLLQAITITDNKKMTMVLICVFMVLIVYSNLANK